MERRIWVHGMVGVGVLLIVVGLFVVPMLEISQPRYGFDATVINGTEIEDNDWTVEEFTYLSSADKDRVRTMVNDGLYYSAGDEDPFHFDVVIYDGQTYHIELAEITEPAPFPDILTILLVAIGLVFVSYGSYRVYRDN